MGTVAISAVIHEEAALDPDAMAGVEAALLRACGVSLGAGLLRTLRAGVVEAAASLGVASRELARRILAGDSAALAALVDHSLVGETRFWRPPEQLAALERHALDAPGPMRIWCAGCASGEEAYSLAMALLEAGRADRGDRILATDVSERALGAARAGVYGERTLRQLSAARRARWLRGAPPSLEVAPELRRLVAFAAHNLVAEPPPARDLDLVVCRNVLIYFEPDTAAEVLYKLVSALRPGGFLLLGPVELPLAAPLALEWVTDFEATLLRAPA